MAEASEGDSATASRGSAEVCETRRYEGEGMDIDVDECVVEECVEVDSGAGVVVAGRSADTAAEAGRQNRRA